MSARDDMNRGALGLWRLPPDVGAGRQRTTGGNSMTEMRVNACCGEPECTRQQPIGLYLTDFSNQVYAVTRWSVDGTLPDGRERRRAAIRHDITEQARAFIRANEAWVRDVLKEENA